MRPHLDALIGQLRSATDPGELRRHPDPIGPANDAVLVESARTAARIILAWGNHGRHRNRADAVRAMLATLNRPLYCMRINRASGEPAHPL